MEGVKSRFTLRRYKAEDLLAEYMTSERFEDCFNMMCVMEDTERFEYYEIEAEEVFPDGTVKHLSSSYFSKSADDIDEIYF